jgi:hypothetical protein
VRKARQEEHARERAAIIKRGQREEAKQRREEIRMQENPASAEWIEPPRYELS